jgi:glycosyltransferase involved in cell wall biosynthesis
MWYSPSRARGPAKAGSGPKGTQELTIPREESTPAPPVLSLVIPAHNESESVPRVLNSFATVMREIPVNSEIILVDDDSTDGTGECARAVPGVTVVRNACRLGYGHSLLRGIEAARGRFVAIADADGTYPADALPRLWQVIEEGAEHVIGSRTGPELSTHFGLRAFYVLLCQYVVGERVPDANSGLRIFDRRLVERLRADLCFGFSFTTSLTLASLMTGHIVVFREIPFRRRVGRSHVRRTRDILRTLQYLFQLIAFYNPLKLFLPLLLLTGALAGAGLAWGLLAGSALGAELGIAMLCTALLLAGIAALSYVVARAGAPRAWRASPEDHRGPAGDPDSVV